MKEVRCRLLVSHSNLEVGLMLVRMCVCVCVCVAAGWEHVYDFMEHVFGPQQSGGVPMHMGHYAKHVNSRLKGLYPNRAGFFSNNQWIEFLTTAMCLVMMSMPAETHSACCELDMLGGDGTGIGITSKRAMEIKPIWDPPEPCTPRVEWNRRERSISRMDYKHLSPKQSNDVKQWLRKVTEPDADIPSVRKDIHKNMKLLDENVGEEVSRFVFMEDTEPEFEHLRKLIRSYASDESVTGMMKPHSLDRWKTALEYLNPNSQKSASIEQWIADCKELRNWGIGPEATAIINFQVSESGIVRIRKSTWRLLSHIGENRWL